MMGAELPQLPLETNRTEIYRRIKEPQVTRFFSAVAYASRHNFHCGHFTM